MRIVYPATVEKIDNQYWLEFPDLEGCQTWGDTLEETLNNATEALEGYMLVRMENELPINEPSELSDVCVYGNMEKHLISCEINVDK